MTEAQAKLMKLTMQYELLDTHRHRDMASINALTDVILNIFGEEIVWDRLHIADKETPMHKLQLIIKEIKNVTVSSNQHANTLRRDYNEC